MDQATTDGPLHQAGTYQPIEDYAMIGNLHTVALVSKKGSIDWCCIPSFDAPSVFGALLDVNKGGHFSIAPPLVDGMHCKQLYIPDTNVLITRILSIDGVGEITDFMPINESGSASHQHYLLRSVAVVRGTLSFDLVCRPAFNYARDIHEVYLSDEGAVFRSEKLCLGLSSSVPLQEDGAGGVRATFTLHTGQSLHFLLESAKDSDITPDMFRTGATTRPFKVRCITGDTGSPSASIADAGVKWSTVRHWP